MRFYNNKELNNYFKRQNIKFFFNYRRDKRRASKKHLEVCTDINQLRINDICGGDDTHPKLRKYMWDKGKFFIFRIPEVNHDVFFIINEQLEIFVFFKESDNFYNVLPIGEFIDKYWDRFSKEKGLPLFFPH